MQILYRLVLIEKIVNKNSKLDTISINNWFML